MCQGRCTAHAWMARHPHGRRQVVWHSWQSVRHSPGGAAPAWPCPGQRPGPAPALAGGLPPRPPPQHPAQRPQQGPRPPPRHPRPHCRRCHPRQQACAAGGHPGSAALAGAAPPRLCTLAPAPPSGAAKAGQRCRPCRAGLHGAPAVGPQGGCCAAAQAGWAQNPRGRPVQGTGQRGSHGRALGSAGRCWARRCRSGQPRPSHRLSAASRQSRAAPAAPHPPLSAGCRHGPAAAAGCAPGRSDGPVHTAGARQSMHVRHGAKAVLQQCWTGLPEGQPLGWLPPRQPTTRHTGVQARPTSRRSPRAPRLPQLLRSAPGTAPPPYLVQRPAVPTDQVEQRAAAGGRAAQAHRQLVLPLALCARQPSGDFHHCHLNAAGHAHRAFQPGRARMCCCGKPETAVRSAVCSVAADSARRHIPACSCLSRRPSPASAPRQPPQPGSSTHLRAWKGAGGRA